MALAERWREALPPGEFEVECEGCMVHISGLPPHAGNGSVNAVAVGALLLRLPLPAALSLRLFFDDELDGMQDFVSKVYGRPWPAADAKPRVRVTDEAVHAWFGPGDEESATVRLRPFPRADIGM